MNPPGILEVEVRLCGGAGGGSEEGSGGGGIWQRKGTSEGILRR